jgi:hypothetical protein
MYSITLEFPTLEALVAAVNNLTESSSVVVRVANTSRKEAPPAAAPAPAAPAATAEDPPAATERTQETSGKRGKPKLASVKAPPEPAVEKPTYESLRSLVLSLHHSGHIDRVKALLKAEFGGKPNFLYLQDESQPDEIARAIAALESIVAEVSNA